MNKRSYDLIPEVSAQPVWRSIASQHWPTMRIKPIAQSTGKRLRSSIENKTVLPDGSRKLYISARKVIELWIETRTVISWVTPTTAILMRQLIVASRLGRTEYQLLMMKILWWDRYVKIRHKCLVVIDEFFNCIVIPTKWIYFLKLTNRNWKDFTGDQVIETCWKKTCGALECRSHFALLLRLQWCHLFIYYRSRTLEHTK